MTNTATEADRAELSGSSMNDKPDSDFAYVEPGGTKDSSGKTVPRSKRHFYIGDAAHVRNALSRLPQADPQIAAKARPAIEAAARKFGIGAPAEAAAGRNATWPFNAFVRSFIVEDIRVLTRANGQEFADGRTVEALTAPFDHEVPIVDGQGRYRETIDRGAFDRTLDQLRPQGRRANWRVGVFYNHGMTIHGTPSDTNSRPIGVPLDIRTDAAGLITMTRYAQTPLGDEVLELIKSGALNGHSFTGRVVRSAPEPHSRLGYRPGPDGVPPLVKRLELGLREYGPTPFPAYDTTAVMGVRSFFSSDTLPDDPFDGLGRSEDFEGDPSDDTGTSPDEGEPAPGDPPADEPDEAEGEHSGRSDDQAVRHAALATRIARERLKRPGL